MAQIIFQSRSGSNVHRHVDQVIVVQKDQQISHTGHPFAVASIARGLLDVVVSLVRQ